MIANESDCKIEYLIINDKNIIVRNIIFDMIDSNESIRGLKKVQRNSKSSDVDYLVMRTIFGLYLIDMISWKRSLYKINNINSCI